MSVFEECLVSSRGDRRAQSSSGEQHADCRLTVAGFYVVNLSDQNKWTMKFYCSAFSVSRSSLVVLLMFNSRLLDVMSPTFQTMTESNTSPGSIFSSVLFPALFKKKISFVLTSRFPNGGYIGCKHGKARQLQTRVAKDFNTTITLMHF